MKCIRKASVKKILLTKIMGLKLTDWFSSFLLNLPVNAVAK